MTLQCPHFAYSQILIYFWMNKTKNCYLDVFRMMQTDRLITFFLNYQEQCVSEYSVSITVITINIKVDQHSVLNGLNHDVSALK